MRKFHVGDILSITTGYLVAPSGMDGVYKILNYMTGDNLYTHQLPRASEQCAPILAKLYPALSRDNPKMTTWIENLNEQLSWVNCSDVLAKEHLSDICNNWVEQVRRITCHEEELEVPKLDNYTGQNPIEELAQMLAK